MLSGEQIQQRVAVQFNAQKCKVMANREGGRKVENREELAEVDSFVSRK